LITSYTKFATSRPGFEVGRCYSSVTRDRVVDLHRSAEIPVQIEQRDHALAENAGLGQHADRGRHRQRAVRDARPERRGFGEHLVDMNGRENADQAGKQIDVAGADRAPRRRQRLSWKKRGHGACLF
jgi:hypothetical protein